MSYWKFINVLHMAVLMQCLIIVQISKCIPKKSCVVSYLEFNGIFNRNFKNVDFFKVMIRVVFSLSRTILQDHTDRGLEMPNWHKMNFNPKGLVFQMFGLYHPKTLKQDGWV